MTSRDSPIPIRQTDPRAGYLAQQTAIDAAIARVLGGGLYILGNEVEAFEALFAAFIGVAHAIGCANGTDAIELALRACSIGAGDLVFTVSHTAVATVAAIEWAGATPVLVDVEPGKYTMAPEELSRVVQRPPPGRPAAVLPVHLYGQPADLSALSGIAREHGLRLIEDCAQKPRWPLLWKADRIFRRCWMLQFLPDEESWRTGRWRCGGHEPAGSRSTATRNPRIWLARPVC